MTDEVASPTKSSYCRLCYNACALSVDVLDGRAVAVRGDPDNPLYQGYTCVKGRLQPELLYDAHRLLHSQRRTSLGRYEPVASRVAITEIAEQLSGIRDRYGPDAIAFYAGTVASNSSTTVAMMDAFVEAVGSKMRFSPNTIDKPGKSIAQAMLGTWMAPTPGYSDPQVALLIGINPPISYQGAPRGNPAKWLTEQVARGMELIVVDPRATETARRATLHLQPRPGHDAAILAVIARIIIDEELYDKAFVEANVVGLDRLRRAVGGYDPALVAAAADIALDDLISAARAFGRSRRGYVSCGTGPNMSGPGTLIEYLALCLDTVCGHVLRAGDVVRNAVTLLPTPAYRAQAAPPVAATGLLPLLSASGLSTSAAGPPIAGLPAEMLRKDDRRVRALISCGGNPASAWPDQGRVVDALRNLDLLVQIDPWMSNTARLAHYVIAPTMPLETADTTQAPLDTMSQLTIGYGLADSYAQYTPALVDPPSGADVVDEWVFFFELTRAMGLALTIRRQFRAPIGPITFDMSSRPTTDELLELFTGGARIQLAEVKAHSHGEFFPAPACRVEPAEPGWQGKLDVGNELIMDDLARLTAEANAPAPVVPDDHERPFRLIPRRVQHVYNSSYHHPKTARGRLTNPAFLHPADMEALQLSDGDEVLISSAHATVRAQAVADKWLRRGVVSMTHCFGGLPDEAQTSDAGANTALLLGLDVLQPHSAQPLMGNVRVAVTPNAKIDNDIEI